MQNINTINTNQILYDNLLEINIYNNFTYDNIDDIFSKYQFNNHKLNNISNDTRALLFKNYLLEANKDIINDHNIKKNIIVYKKKFIYKSNTISYFMILKILLKTINKSHIVNILTISNNYKLIEPIKYYLPNALINNKIIDQNTKSENEIQPNLTKFKSIYKFNDEIFDIKTQKAETTYQFFYIDLINNSNLIDHIYALLDKLDIGGYMILSIDLLSKDVLSKDVLLCIQNIALIFATSYIYDTDMSIYGKNIFLFYNYTGKKKYINKYDNGFVQSITKYLNNIDQRIEKFNEKLIYIENNKDKIGSIINQNKRYAYDVAHKLNLKIYKKSSIKKYYGKTLEKLYIFDIGQHMIMRKHNKNKIYT